MYIRKLNRLLEEMIQVQQEYLLINIKTAECIIFNNIQIANKFISENNITLYTSKNKKGKFILIKAYEDQIKPELVLYNTKSSRFPYVAEYQDDLSNMDLISSLDTPVRYAYYWDME